MAGFDLNSVLQAFSTAKEGDAATVAAVQKTAESSKQLYGQLNDAILGGTDSRGNTIEGVRQEMLATQKAQAASARFASTVGTNLDDPNEILSSLGLQYNETSAKAQEAQDELTRKQSVGFFDNPLMYMFNQATVNEDEAKTNALATKAAMLKTQISDLNQATQQTAVTQNAIKQTITDGVIAAQASAQANDLKQKAIASRLDANSNYVNSLMNINKLNNDQATAVYQAHAAITADEHLALAQRSQALQEQKFREAKANDTYMVNYARSGAGSDSLFKNMPDRALLMIMKDEKSDPVMKAAITQAINQGIIYESHPEMRGRIVTDSPAKLAALGNSGIIKLPDVSKATESRLKDIVAALPEFTDKKLIPEHINKEFNRLMVKDGNIDPANGTNIFNSGSIISQIPMYPALADNPVVKIMQEQGTENYSTAIGIALKRGLSPSVVAANVQDIGVRLNSQRLLNSSVESMGAGKPPVLKDKITSGRFSGYYNLGDKVQATAAVMSIQKAQHVTETTARFQAAQQQAGTIANSGLQD